MMTLQMSLGTFAAQIPMDIFMGPKVPIVADCSHRFFPLFVSLKTTCAFLSRFCVLHMGSVFALPKDDSVG